MRDARIVEIAGRQFNRISRSQLRALGLHEHTIDHRVARGRLVIVEQGVFAVAPVLDDDRGRWSGATLTAPGTVLSHASASSAWGFWAPNRSYETVTRPGDGGPRRHGGLLVFRSRTLDGECTDIDGLPITTAPRTLLDLARDTRGVSDSSLARALRDAVRLKRTTVGDLAEFVRERRTRRGSRRLLKAVGRYAGLPIERARSGAEVRALEVLRRAQYSPPRLNVRIAGEEADLSWPEWRLIIEIDGGPFHLDVGEDERKEAAWRAAGWTVRRIPSDDVYKRPVQLLRLATPPSVPHAPT
jgi:very-short-patch-repair endonuclease